MFISPHKTPGSVKTSDWAEPAQSLGSRLPAPMFAVGIQVASHIPCRMPGFYVAFSLGACSRSGPYSAVSSKAIHRSLGAGLRGSSLFLCGSQTRLFR